MLSCSIPIFCLVFLVLPNGWLILCVSNVPGYDVPGEWPNIIKLCLIYVYVCIYIYIYIYMYIDISCCFVSSHLPYVNVTLVFCFMHVSSKLHALSL
jgi:hypothetical protein